MSGAFWKNEKDWDGVPIPSDFFVKIDKIAHMIGRLLKRKGIEVRQCKEKFGQVRVYCDLIPEQEADYIHIYWKVIARLPDYAKYIVSGMDHPELLGLQNYCFVCRSFMHEIRNKEYGYMEWTCYHQSLLKHV